LTQYINSNIFDSSWEVYRVETYTVKKTNKFGEISLEKSNY